ncbi:MAG: hypothetical protein P8O03_00345 [Ilumatobacter sp.]|nr:hypothetical protein [Ilumatobacter sp.]
MKDATATVTISNRPTREGDNMPTTATLISAPLHESAYGKLKKYVNDSHNEGKENADEMFKDNAVGVLSKVRLLDMILDVRNAVELNEANDTVISQIRLTIIDRLLRKHFGANTAKTLATPTMLQYLKDLDPAIDPTSD